MQSSLLDLPSTGDTGLGGTSNLNSTPREANANTHTHTHTACYTLDLNSKGR